MKESEKYESWLNEEDWYSRTEEEKEELKTEIRIYKEQERLVEESKEVEKEMKRRIDLILNSKTWR